MSNYSDINQWLAEMGASDRSAGDPWTITRGSRSPTSGTSFSPSVVADLGAPAQNLTSEMQSAEQITNADQVAMGATGSSKSTSSKSSSSSGLLGGLLDFFPLGSLVGKLFGLGGSSSPSPLTQYVAPPSVNFQGAMSSSLSQSTASSLPGSPASDNTPQAATSSFAPGIGSLSYGENGLPRTANEISQLATVSSPQTSSTVPAAVTNQLSSLTSSNFAAQPAESPSMSPAAAMASVPDAQESSQPSMSSGSPGASSQGQSILVQVQAMDSQSFMDHSNDIAQAVRQAMLNMHSVNDVIADL